jgi:hypothetical protein
MGPLPVAPRSSGTFPTSADRLPAVQSAPLFADRPPSWQLSEDAGASVSLQVTDADVVSDLSELDEGWS